MSIVSFLLSKKTTQSNKKGLARVAKNVAVITVAVSVAVVLVGYAIVGGYKNQLFGAISAVFGDYNIEARDTAARWVAVPVNVSSQLVNQIENIEGVDEVLRTSQAGAVIKTGSGMSGVLACGVDFDKFLNSKTAAYLVEYEDVAEIGDEVIISQDLATKNGLEVGDDVSLIFFGDNPILVEGTLVGTFNTHLGEVDQSVVWMSIGKLNELLDYEPQQADYLKVKLVSGANIDKFEEQLDVLLDDNLVFSNAQSQHSHIFDWIFMLDNNIALLLIIVSIVAGINIISVVLIVILENTTNIGILKSVGMKNFDLMLVYGLKTVSITLKGVIGGIIIGLGFCFAQLHWQIIKLDPQSYLVDAVPIEVSFVQVALISVVALLIATFFALIPTLIISKIYPYKTLKFE